jgi:hypothetical protein
MRRTSRSTPASSVAPADPIGIVIADGGRGERAPRLAAFVWGPIPDDEPEWRAAPASALAAATG